MYNKINVDSDGQKVPSLPWDYTASLKDSPDCNFKKSSAPGKYMLLNSPALLSTPDKETNRQHKPRFPATRGTSHTS